MKEFIEINYLCILERVFILRVVFNLFFLNGIFKFCVFELYLKFFKEKLFIFKKNIYIL